MVFVEDFCSKRLIENSFENYICYLYFHSCDKTLLFAAFRNSSKSSIHVQDIRDSKSLYRTTVLGD